MKKTLDSLTWSDFPNPCYDPHKRYGDFSGTIMDILRDQRIPAEDRLWAMTRDGILDDRTLRLFACKCVRSTPLADGRVLWALLGDARSRDAVDVAERFANGEATTEELDAAEIAAGTAWAATNADAEHHAAWKVTARKVAGVTGASWIAAWMAADAAWDAAWVAKGGLRFWARHARYAATAAQVQFAIDLIKENYEC